MATDAETINQLNTAWIQAGQTVSDLESQVNEALLDDNTDSKAFTDLMHKRDETKKRRDALKKQLDEMGANQKVNSKLNEEETSSEQASKVNPVNDEQKGFVNDFRRMLLGDPKFQNVVTISDDPNTSPGAGLTIPKDIQTRINEYLRQTYSLQQYVRTESVSTMEGKRVYEKFSTITPLADLDDDAGAIADNDEPSLLTISYKIHRYAGMNTLTNTLVKESDENIINWLTNWIVKKVIVTRNQKIVANLNAVPGKPTVANFDDIKDLNNKTIDPALISGSIFLTNVTGFSILAKVKNEFGGYLIQPDVKNSEIYRIGSKEVVVVADRDLPDLNSTTHPLYFGNMEEAITLYDREHQSLASTNVGDGAFRHDLTRLRVIDRFDVQNVDKEAMVAASFRTIDDLKPLPNTPRNGGGGQ